MNQDGKTIVACATNSDRNQALAVVRISGSFDLKEFAPFISLSISKIKPRYVHLVNILENHNVLDEACMVFFPGPSSFTGENILEFSIHGNRINVERIVQLFASRPGCRLALPGEFAQRAFLNKKLSLSQIEGLDIFLSANSRLALEQGMSLLNGQLALEYTKLHDYFTQHQSALEILIDFSEDVGEQEAQDNLQKTFDDLFSAANSLYKRTFVGSALLSPEIVIFGAPNAGKSTFFNFLLGEKRALVSSQAGTTRDYISETISIDGNLFRLLDTAGVRETKEEVEAKGVELGLNLTKKAFYKILLINPLEPNPDLSDLIKIGADLVLFTHSDLEGAAEKSRNILKLFDVGAFSQQISLISAPTDVLKQIKGHIQQKFTLQAAHSPLLVDRQKQVITATYGLLESYRELLNTSPNELGILAHELEAIGYCLSELIGIVSPDEVLDNIFSRFCIGK
jgi:tRNA modification GTPase